MRAQAPWEEGEARGRGAHRIRRHAADDGCEAYVARALPLLRCDRRVVHLVLAQHVRDLRAQRVDRLEEHLVRRVQTMAEVLHRRLELLEPILQTVLLPRGVRSLFFLLLLPRGVERGEC